MMDVDKGQVIRLHMQGQTQADHIILDLLRYWENLRGGRAVPLRSEIDPREINSALEHTFIIELTRDGRTRFRLAGAKVCDLLGMELRAMPGHALIETFYREQFNEILNDVMTKPEIIDLNLIGEVSGAGSCAARMLLLPLQDQHGKTTRVLGCVSPRSGQPRPPVRFDIMQVKRTRIVAGVNLDLNAPRPQPETGFQDHAADFAHGSRAAVGDHHSTAPLHRSERPYLRLVKG